MNKPSIAVVGGTGAQGGGLVQALLRDPDQRFSVRALTRNPDGERARALARAGAQLVAADLDDARSLARAFDGAHGVFGVTNFWEHFSPERELAQAQNIATAARDAAVAHVVWSTLEETRLRVPLTDTRMPTLMGRYKVPHFDAKGEANRFFRELALPTTFLYTSFYWDNLIHFGMGPRRDAEGALVFTLPMGSRPLPGIAVADIGGCAFGVFAQGAALIGRDVGIAGGHLTGAEMAEALSRTLGEPVRYHPIAPAQYAQLGFPGAEDLANMFQFKQEFNDAFCAARPIAATRKLYPALSSFASWAERHREQLKVPPPGHTAVAA